MFEYYNNKGPLYIILQKSTNTRWQFQFESSQYMDEKDNEINIFDFFKSNKKIFGIFKKLGYVDYKPNQWKINNTYYNDKGNLHREDGPAYIVHKYQYWYKDGKIHREDGPAVINPNGSQAWFKDGERHREYGPAVIYPDGTQAWYKDGKRHREDGPAVINPNGYQAWFKDGEQYTQEKWKKEVSKLKEDISINRLKILAGIK